jgi:hypothetical protein
MITLLFIAGIIGPPMPLLAASQASTHEVVLTAGKTQVFTATRLLTDGSSTAVASNFSASGGTISQSGVYEAGNSAGVYQVISAVGGLADTAMVYITSPATTPGHDLSDVVTRALAACKALDLFWKSGACRELAHRIAAARERARAPIGFDARLLQLILITLLLGSAGVLEIRRPGRILALP